MKYLPTNDGERNMNQKPLASNAHQRTLPPDGANLSIALPDQRQAWLWNQTALLVFATNASAHGSPVHSVYRLSREAYERLACFFRTYPSVCPAEAFVARPPRTRKAKLRLYERMVTLRSQLEGSGLSLVPVTERAGYLLASSSVAPPPDERLQHTFFGEDSGMTLDPATGALVAWRQGVLLECQWYPPFQMHLLMQVFAEYPYYCPYERLYAAKKQIPYDPVTVRGMLERVSRQKSLHPIHRTLAPTRTRLDALGLHLACHRDLGYQLTCDEPLWGYPA